jgi:hypothetical protein
MDNKSKTKCLSCREIFTVDVRSRGRQKYCSKPACRAANKAARQPRLREQPQNQDYFLLSRTGSRGTGPGLARGPSGVLVPVFLIRELGP